MSTRRFLLLFVQLRRWLRLLRPTLYASSILAIRVDARKSIPLNVNTLAPTVCLIVTVLGALLPGRWTAT